MTNNYSKERFLLLLENPNIRNVAERVLEHAYSFDLEGEDMINMLMQALATYFNSTTFTGESNEIKNLLERLYYRLRFVTDFNDGYLDPVLTITESTPFDVLFSSDSKSGKSELNDNDSMDSISNPHCDIDLSDEIGIYIGFTNIPRNLIRYTDALYDGKITRLEFFEHCESFFTILNAAEWDFKDIFKARCFVGAIGYMHYDFLSERDLSTLIRYAFTFKDFPNSSEFEESNSISEWCRVPDPDDSD